ncbi:hypothetical protein AB0M43_12895 [Longispora sp. NPDC051575]|uniref:hypothetical protein n=1 Tax=Longispora sp. NPDC051575 TaxID=3154943 RepID=UPI003440B1F4
MSLYRDLIARMAIDDEFAVHARTNPDEVARIYRLGVDETEKLRKLVDARTDAGPTALGARLSKTGFGGASVSLIPHGLDWSAELGSVHQPLVKVTPPSVGHLDPHLPLGTPTAPPLDPHLPYGNPTVPPVDPNLPLAADPGVPPVDPPVPPAAGGTPSPTYPPTVTYPDAPVQTDVVTPGPGAPTDYEVVPVEPSGGVSGGAQSLLPTATADDSLTTGILYGAAGVAAGGVIGGGAASLIRLPRKD